MYLDIAENLKLNLFFFVAQEICSGDITIGIIYAYIIELFLSTSSY